jgi:hypothetical protein
MPYGIPNEKPAQTKWMERCVGHISGTNPRTDKPYTDSEKIAICKAQLKKQNWKVSEEIAEEQSLREQFYALEDKMRDALTPMRDMVQPSYGPYIADIFDDYVIVEKGSDLYKVPYVMKGDDVSFDWSNAVEVERRTAYDPVKEAEREKELICQTELPLKRPQHRRITQGYETIN